MVGKGLLGIWDIWEDGGKEGLSGTWNVLGEEGCMGMWDMVREGLQRIW